MCLKISTIIDGVNVIANENITNEEAKAYIDYVNKNSSNGQLDKLELNFDGNNVDINCSFKPVPFTRLRRVTGYLSGRSIEAMNDGKRAEVRDRVKHSIN